MNDNTTYQMQTTFGQHYKDRQKDQTDYSKNQNFEQLAQNQQMTELVQMNLKAQEEFVNTQIFAGNLKKQAEEDLDYSYDYVFQDAKETIERKNQEVKDRIGQLPAANIEEHGSLKAEIPLGQSMNKPPKAASWKDRGSENSTLKQYREVNQNTCADISTVREMKTLTQYNELRRAFIRQDENHEFENELFRNAARSLSAWMIKPDEFAPKKKEPKAEEKSKEELEKERQEKAKADANKTQEQLKAEKEAEESAKKQAEEEKKAQEEARKKEQAKEDADNYLRFALLPFMKIYKKGWFGRKYTIDGKRIINKEGELTEDEFNAQFLDIMTSDTRFAEDDEGRTNEQVKENRKNKGKFIMLLAKELMDKKIDASMLTDEYLAEHVGEMQQYADQLNAFRLIVDQNQWVFKTGEANAQEDELLESLVEARIYQVSDRLNIFMDEHYAAHGMWRRVKSKFKERGIMNPEKEPELLNMRDSARKRKRVVEMAREQEGRAVIDDAAFEAMTEIKSFYGENNKDNSYRSEQALSTAFPIELVGSREREWESEEDRESYLRQAGKLKDDLEGNIRKASKGLQEAYNKGNRYAEKMLNLHLVDKMKGREEEIHQTAQKAIAKVEEKIKGGSEMKLVFGPEIEQLYAKLYASRRLDAELQLRYEILQNYVDQKIYESFDYKTKNPYVGESLNKYLRKDLRNRVFDVRRSIEKEREDLKENDGIIEKSIDFFLNGADARKYKKEELAQIRSHLEKEGMGHIFESTKIDRCRDVMDEMIYEAKKEVASKDVGDPNKVPEIKKAEKITPKEWAAQIHKVRTRETERVALEQSISEEDKNYNYDEDQYAKVMPYCKNLNLDDVKMYENFNEIPTSKKEFHTFYMTHKIELAAKEITEDPRQYKKLSNLKFMKEQYELQYALKERIKDKDVFKYMARTRARVDFLAAHAKATEAVLRIQRNPLYPYLDVAPIRELEADQLKELIDKLKSREKSLQGKIDERVAQDKNKLNARDNSELEKQIEETKNMRLIAEAYQDIKGFQKKYSGSTEQAIESIARRYELDLRGEHARKNSFRLADDRYVELEDIFSDVKEQILVSANWIARLRNAERDEKKIESDDTLRDMLKAKCGQLLEINVGDNIARLTRLNDRETRLDPKDVMELGKCWGVIHSLSGLLTKIENPEANKGNSEVENRLIKIIQGEKELLSAVRGKIPQLTFLEKAIENCLSTYNFKPRGRKLYEWGTDSKDVTDADIQKSIEDSKKAYLENLKALEDVSKERKPDEVEALLSEAKDAVFKELLDKGAKLSMLELDKWKKEVEGIAKWSGIFENASSKHYWRRIAALQILDNWPYAFEQFYALRIKDDTYRAFGSQMKRLFGKEGADILTPEQIQKSVDISQYVSEQESQTYFVLNENATKELDRVLEANGYDKKAFKFIFNKVKVNGAGMPLTGEEHKRYENESIARTARGFISMSSQKKKEYFGLTELHRDKVKSLDKDYMVIDEFVRDLQERLITPLVTDPHLVNMNESMLEEKYIEEHFKELYELSQKIGCLATIYEQNKEYFTADAFLMGMKDPKGIEAIIDNNFGTRKNGMIVRYKELIDAYVNKNFVDASGSFDIGLSVEDLVSDENKKMEKEKRQARKEKLQKVVDDRKAAFAKSQKDVDAELNRSIIAKHTAEAERALKVIQSEKMSEKLNFSSTRDKLHHVEGHISDFGLLVQDKKMMGEVQLYKLLEEQAEEANAEYQKLSKEQEIQRSKDEAVPASERRKTEAAWKKRQELIERRNKQHDVVRSYVSRAEEYYDIYQKCHDEDGKLKLEGVSEDIKDKYVNFHATLADEMAAVFNGFVQMYDENKGDIFDPKFVAAQMKKKNWGEVFTGYRRFGLYIAMLLSESKIDTEADEGFFGMVRKVFSIFGKGGDKGVFSENSDFIKYLNNRISDLDAEYKRENAAFSSKYNKEYKEQLQSAKKKTDELQKKYDEIIQRGEVLSETFAPLYAKKTELEKKIETIKGNVKVGETAKVDDTIFKYTEELESTNKTITDLRKQFIQTIQEDKLNVEKELAKARAESEKLEKQIDDEMGKIKKLEESIRNHQRASKVLVGLTTKFAEKASIFQDYIRQVELVLTSYGVKEDGELLEDWLSEEEKKENMDVVHEHSDEAFKAVIQQEKNMREQAHKVK